MIQVVFEDNHLLVLDKPAGLLTQPSGTEQESLEGLGKAWLKQKYQKPGNVFLSPIHRLDRAASGIVVFAKTSKALSRLTAEMRQKNTIKIYHALVKPPPRQEEGVLEHYLIHDDYRATIVGKESREAKHCRLFFKVLKQEKDKKALLHIALETGRYHQIRAQLSAIGSPIVGDKKYGSQDIWKHPGIALHHCHFEIAHPITKENLAFDCKPAWE